VSDTEIPPPPDPDPPPPSDPLGPTEATDAERYVEHLARLGRPPGEPQEDVGLRIGDWRFYHRGSPMRREDLAGVDSAGHVIDGYTPGDWYDFLSEPAVDAQNAHQRVAWLLGRAGRVGAEYPFTDAKVAAVVSGPTLDRAGDTVTFEGWVVYPPEMQYPHRLRIVAHPGTKVTIEAAQWSEVGGE